MGLLGIILTVAIIALVVYVIWWLFLRKSKLLSNCRSGTKPLTIPANKLHGNRMIGFETPATSEIDSNEELNYIKFQISKQGSLLKNFLDNKEYERDT